MHIKKTEIQTYENIGPWLTYGPVVYEYAVHYRGFVASGPDLGACIGKCYAAANPTL